METTKIKIFWIVPHLNLWQGGYRFIADLCKQTSNQITTTIGYSSGKQDLIRHFEQSNVITKKIGAIGTNIFWYWVLSPLFILVEIICSLKTTKNNDKVIASLFPSIFVSAVCAKIFKKDFIHFCFVPYPWFYDEKFIDEHKFYLRVAFKFLRFIYTPLDKWAAKSAKKTITLDPISAEQIHTVYGIKAFQISLGIDTKHFRPINKKRNEIYKKYSSNKIIFHSTDYSHLKKTERVIDIFTDVQKKIPNTLLLISTTRPGTADEIRIKNKIVKLGLSKKIILTGKIEYQLLPYYFSAASCYISLAENTAMSNVNLPVKEALACETAAIRTQTIVPDVTNNKSGFIVNPNNKNQVINRIMYLLNNPLRAKKMGVWGRKSIIQQYSWERTSEKFVSLIANNKSN